MQRFRLFLVLAVLGVCMAVPQGIWATECEAVAGNLVQAATGGNCGFELGTFGGWSHTGDTGFDFIATAAPYIHSGTHAAALGPVGDEGFLTATLATVAGATYTISFWLYSDPGAAMDHFNTFWNGTMVLSHASCPVGCAFAQYSVNVTATGATSTLQFRYRQDPAWWGLDDVVVVPAGGGEVPEPGSMILLGTGLAGIAARLRRKVWAQSV